ncbi:AAA family ATPase [Bacillus solitudinis]|uniref:AAA family ATPase n=1 Tax=Bacillus solitudinis TaxID=2014074 RepID=UPI000C23E1CC|nr:AAA family ATPase [Bacillus solitudinis]
MSNIKSVRLENFQSHLDTHLDLHDGLNVLVGQSDSGKTAVLRGIRWVLFNLPRGTDFIKVGADFVRVSITFSHETTIIRERTSSKNRYIIRKPDQDDLILEGFGTHVPEEVIRAHGMNSLRIDRDHELFLHISQQLDGPFLLEQTGSLRAKTIGRISGAHYLDMAIRDTSKDISQLQQRVKLDEQEITELSDQLQPFQMLTSSKEKLDVVQQKLEQLTFKKDRLSKLKEKSETAQSIERNFRRTDQIIRYVQPLEEWEKVHESLKLLANRLLTLRQKYNHLEELEQTIHVCRTWIDKTSKVFEASLIEQRIQKQYEKYKAISKTKIGWETLQNENNRAERILEKTTFIKSRSIHQLEKVEADEKQRMKLANVSHLLTTNVQEETHLRKWTHLFKGIEKANQLKETIHGKLEVHQQFKDRFIRIKELEVRLQEGRQFLHTQKTEQQELEHNYQHLLANEGTCPTCGNDFDAGKVQSLFNR